MPFHRRKPPSTDGDRRHEKRREVDVEQADLLDHIVTSDAPIVSKLLRTGRVMAVVIPLCTFGGGLAGALGYKVVGPMHEIARVDSTSTKISARVDSTNAAVRRTNERIDSMFSNIAALQHDVEMMAFVQCVQLRRDNPDLRPRGCDETEARERARKP